MESKRSEEEDKGLDEDELQEEGNYEEGTPFEKTEHQPPNLPPHAQPENFPYPPPSHSDPTSNQVSSESCKSSKSSDEQLSPHHVHLQFKQCCAQCRKPDKKSKGKKLCNCLTPPSQRRTLLPPTGCQICGCLGCSKEDIIKSAGELCTLPSFSAGKPVELSKSGGHGSSNDSESSLQNQSEEDGQPTFEARNGCCRKCMKAFSKSNKSCLCQVPETVRKGRLPSHGCRICGCMGCNPEDKKESKDRKGKNWVRKCMKKYRHQAVMIGVERGN